MTYSDILYSVEDGIARITINRAAKHNAFRLETVGELTDAFERAEVDQTVGVAVLTGAGDKAFCSGGDVGMEEAFTPATGRALVRADMKLAAAMRGLGKPIIARVNGWCIGSGNCLNLLCDLSIAAEDAKLGQIGPQVGSVPTWISTQVLPYLVGPRKAREIIFMCRQYTAMEAEQMGWINKAVPRERLDDEVNAWCQRILDLSPQSLRIAKMNLNYFEDLAYPALIHGMEMLALTYGSAEAREGMQAFLEKRKANYRQFRK